MAHMSVCVFALGGFGDRQNRSTQAAINNISVLVEGEEEKNEEEEEGEEGWLGAFELIMFSRLSAAELW